MEKKKTVNSVENQNFTYLMRGPFKELKIDIFKNHIFIITFT